MDCELHDATYGDAGRRERLRLAPGRAVARAPVFLAGLFRTPAMAPRRSRGPDRLSLTLGPGLPGVHRRVDVPADVPDVSVVHVVAHGDELRAVR